MATTDTQQTAQFAAQAAVSAAEAKQYLLSIEQPVIDISESVADAQNAAAAAEMARDQAQGISTSLVQTIDSQLSEQETQFESQMTTQQSSFESSQSERESAFEEKSNEFESRFSSQLSTQESTFSESQTDKENRFQQFLLSSGYQFLGDYENGPYVFSELNQYIEYSGNSYRIASASDIGFTTTGTDATSFANDVTHFVLMDGDTLRQNLGSGDGLKMVGRCASPSSLRLTEPAVDGQWIVLEKAIPGGQIINEILTYDAADTVSPDNGYSVFVTANGRRWKADLSKGYNPLFLLGAVGYESISSCINKIAYDLAVLWGNKKGVIDYCTTIRIPGMPRGETRYNVTGAIHIPSFVTLKMDVDTYFDYYTVTNTDGIIIDNSYFPMLLDSAYDPSPTARPRSVLLWETERDIFTGGRLILTHPIGSARTSNAGITIGNTATGYIDVRGCRVRNFASIGFYYGIKINPIDNYINTFDGFHLGRNNYGVAVLGDTKNNAGERFLFKDGTLADSDSDLIYVENNAFELFFHGCSLDYPTGDLVKITKNGNTYVSFNQCHIEGVQGMLVNVTASTTFPKYGKKIVFSKSILDLGSGQAAPALWNKTWAFSSVINTYLLIEKSCRVWTSTSTMSHAKTAYQSLIVSGQPANNAIVIDFPQNIEDLLDASTVLLGKFNPTGEDKRVISTNRFSGTDGAAYSPSVSTADQWGWYAVNGAWTYSPADTNDGDDLQSISLTSDNVNNVYYLICALPYSVMSQDKFRALGSIKVASGYSGNVNVSCLIEVRSLLTMNSSAVSETTLATTYSPAIDVAAIASSNGRIDKFQGFCTQAGKVNSFSNQTHPMQYVRVGLRISGFTGTISLKIPTVTSHRLLSD